jgi:hypothetical protein
MNELLALICMLLPLGIAKGRLLLKGDTVDGFVSLFIRDDEIVEPPLRRGEVEDC